jgi:hypothetical protein
VLAVKATLIPDRLTPCEPLEVARAFRSALETVTGVTPSNAHLALLVAHSALESGRWKSMHCWNFGNVKASANYEWLYCQFRCNEVIGGKVVWFDPPHPQCNFRAFTNIDAGALDHIRFLSGLKRYQLAWNAAKSGDPSRFVSALKAAGYFTASVEPYRKAVVSLFNEHLRLLSGSGETPASQHDTEPQMPAVTHPTLRLGSVGPDVEALQGLLNRYQAAGLVTDGKMGPKTVRALQTFQRDRSLDADGVCGPRTWAELGLVDGS